MAIYTTAGQHILSAISSLTRLQTNTPGHDPRAMSASVFLYLRADNIKPQVFRSF